MEEEEEEEEEVQAPPPKAPADLSGACVGTKCGRLPGEGASEHKGPHREQDNMAPCQASKILGKRVMLK